MTRPSLHAEPSSTARRTVIIVFFYIQPQINKLLIPFFAGMLRHQLGARFYNFRFSLIIFRLIVETQLNAILGDANKMYLIRKSRNNLS